MRQELEPERFSEWWEKIAHLVSRLVRRYAFSADDALDISQEVAISAFENFSNFVDREHFERWVIQRTKWLTIDRWRKEARAKKRFLEMRSDLNTSRSVESIVEESMTRSEMRSLLGQLIDQLPDQQRKIIQGLLMGKSSREIAEELQLSVSTVRSHRRFARQKLVSLLSKMENTQ